MKQVYFVIGSPKELKYLFPFFQLLKQSVWSTSVEELSYNEGVKHLCNRCIPSVGVISNANIWKTKIWKERTSREKTYIEGKFAKLLKKKKFFLQLTVPNYNAW